MILSRLPRIRNVKLCSSLKKLHQAQIAAFQMKGGFVQGVETAKNDGKNKLTVRSVFEKLSTAFFEILRFVEDDSEVPELNADNFDSYVKSRKRTFVMWYDPFCPVCRRASVDFEKFYQEMKGSLAFGAINATENEEFAISHNISAFPTFRLYVCNGRCSYKHHEGGLSTSEMKSFVSNFSALDGNYSNLMTKTRNITSKTTISRSLSRRIEMKMKQIMKFPRKNDEKYVYDSIISPIEFKKYFSSSPVGYSIANVPRTIKVGKTHVVITKSVMEVNGANFKEKIKSFDSILVYFYTTWCGTCGESLDQFIKAADLIDEDVGVLAMCNGEESLEIVDKYYVGKIPTLKYFRKGRYVTDYIGEIKTELLVKFMKDPHIDEEFLLRVTKHKPHGDLYASEVFTPTQKKSLWQGKGELILEVRNDNVDSVIKENSSLLLLFYACWNKICVGLKHDYLTVAKAVEKSDVILAACDCEEHVEVADRFLISKFPTIKYLKDGVVVRDFNGHWHSESIMEFLKDPSKLQVAAKDERRRLPHQLEEEGIPDYWKGVEGGDKILHFTDFNFEKLIARNPTVLIMFYVTWCKSCTPLKREIGKAAIHLSKDIGMLGSCDAERNNEMADRFSIIKLPTTKYFKNGKYVKDYTGRRTAADIMAFMEDPRVAKELPPLDIKKGSGKKI